MNRLPIFFRWLALVALADWLIARTITRSAIFMPKPPPVIVAYQALSLIGQLASTLAGLLALIAVLWIASESRRESRAIGLCVALPGLAALSVFALMITPGGWPALAYQLLVIAAVVVMSWRVWHSQQAISRKMAWSVPALAMLLGECYHMSQALYTALRWPGPPPFANTLFSLGELFVVLSPIGLWWTFRHTERRDVPAYVWAALATAALVVVYFANPAMTGIVSIWSVGLTLYLPWPVYALSLWLAGVTAIGSLRRGDTAGWAILLLAAGGYAPHFATHVLLSLIGLWLLALSVDVRFGALAMPPASPAHMSMPRRAPSWMS